MNPRSAPEKGAFVPPSSSKIAGTEPAPMKTSSAVPTASANARWAVEKVSISVLLPARSRGGRAPPRGSRAASLANDIRHHRTSFAKRTTLHEALSSASGAVRPGSGDVEARHVPLVERGALGPGAATELIQSHRGAKASDRSARPRPPCRLRRSGDGLCPRRPWALRPHGRRASGCRHARGALRTPVRRILTGSVAAVVQLDRADTRAARSCRVRPGDAGAHDRY